MSCLKPTALLSRPPIDHFPSLGHVCRVACFYSPVADVEVNSIVCRKAINIYKNSKIFNNIFFQTKLYRSSSATSEHRAILLSSSRWAQPTLPTVCWVWQHCLTARGTSAVADVITWQIIALQTAQCLHDNSYQRLLEPPLSLIAVLSLPDVYQFKCCL